MSETLTMDETQVDQPELTPEEQDSLQVGDFGFDTPVL